MKKTNILSVVQSNLYKNICSLLAIFSLLSFPSCESPSYAPEVGSCVDLSFDIDGVSVDSKVARYDTTSFYESIVYPQKLYALVGDTVSFGNLSSHTLSSSSAEIRNVTYLVTCVAENEMTIVAKNVDPTMSFSGVFDSTGIYTLAIYPTWTCSHPNLTNGFSWAINLKIVVVDDISEIPMHVSPIGEQTFNLRLSRILSVEP